LQASTTLDEKSAGEIATMLKSGSQQEVDDVLKRLEASSAKFIEGREKSASRLKTISGTVGAAAPVTPRPAPPVEAAPEDETDEEKIKRLMDKYNIQE
jgi:hypothetical protein